MTLAPVSKPWLASAAHEGLLNLPEPPSPMMFIHRVDRLIGAR